MAENYKHLYAQTKKMLAMYQDELIPGFRKKIEELENNQIKIRCKDCIFLDTEGCPMKGIAWDVQFNDFCSYGERRTDG